jgi:DNA-binding PadR family transcriptional regulator
MLEVGRFSTIRKTVRLNMSDNNKGFDFRSMFESISDSIRSAGSSMATSVQPAEVWSEAGLRNAVIRSLKDGPKTGHDIISTIHSTNQWGIKPAAAKVYPLLESLLDELLVSVSVVKDRKVYSLTKTGKAAEKLLGDVPVDGPSAMASGWNPAQWADLRGSLTTASGRLAKAALDVAQHGTKEQQEAAAAVIDEARRKIHEILAAK